MGLLAHAWNSIDVRSFLEHLWNKVSVRAAYEGFETFLDKFGVLVDIVLPAQGNSAFDHVLTPQHTGDTLTGHNRSADRFVFDDPDLSPNLEYSLIESTASSRGRNPLQKRGYMLETDAAQVKKFRPKDGDVLDFSGLSQELSFSGHTPAPYSVWVDPYDSVVSRYPIKVDLDGDPASIEMGVFLLPTAADRNGRTYDPTKTDRRYVCLCLKLWTELSVYPVLRGSFWAGSIFGYSRSLSLSGRMPC